MTRLRECIRPARCCGKRPDPGGCHWSGVIRRGVDAAPHRPRGRRQLSRRCSTTSRRRVERYNMPDTLKAQHTAFLTDGPRVLLRHGPRAVLDHRGHGGLARHGLRRQSDDATDARTLRHASASRSTATPCTAARREGFLKELGQWGLGKRDLHANLNFFSKVTADDDGQPESTSPAFSRAGAYVDLRFEMHVLVALSTSVASARSAPRLLAAGRSS